VKKLEDIDFLRLKELVKRSVEYVAENSKEQ
jgi:hypothetical protein